MKVRFIGGGLRLSAGVFCGPVNRQRRRFGYDFKIINDNGHLTHLLYETLADALNDAFAEALTGFRFSNCPGSSKRGFSIPFAAAIDCQSVPPITSTKPWSVAPDRAWAIGAVPAATRPDNPQPLPTNRATCWAGLVFFSKGLIFCCNIEMLMLARSGLPSFDQ
jgi:hypothetical protein